MARWIIEKQMVISASHQLNLPYSSKCNNLHGHNWIITIRLASDTLNENDMVTDFTDIKRKIHDFLDHKDLNKILDFRPTAERIAEWCAKQLDNVISVTVEESPNNKVTYEV